jgi:glycogen(starch) synthase
MPQVLMLTLVELDRDPRARRAAAAAASRGISVESGSLRLTPGGAARSPARGVLSAELRGLFRLVRLAVRTWRLVRTAAGKQATVVHAHDLDTLLAAWIIARRLKARVVYDAHELYTGFDRNPPRVWLSIATRIEGALARRSDAVLTVSDGIADELVRRLRLKRRPSVVLNCPPIEEFDLETHRRPPRAIYQAAVGPGRFMDDLPEVQGVEMHARVLGETSAPGHVTLHDAVSPNELIAALQPFDLGLVIDRLDTDNARLALPNKLFDYLMAGLAVVVPDAPAMAELVEREGVGRVYAPGGLADVVAELAGDLPTLENMRRRARAVAVERYNAEAQRPLLYEAWGL